MDIYITWAFLLGLMCAGSLLIGAYIGVGFELQKNTVGLLAAFGAGALLCALVLELVAPSVNAMLSAKTPEAKALETFHFFCMVGGAGAGGIVFVLLDLLLIEHGGYLRKTAYILTHHNHQRKQENLDTKAPHSKTLPSAAQLAASHKSHHNAATAIWLGNLLDGIPESFVLGTLLTSTIAAKASAQVPVALTDVLPYTLIAGMFLSNLPEALSSAAQMRAQGMSKTKIYMMWGSLVLMTGLGAACGAYLGEHIPHGLMIFAEGLAAGAMLTMICAAMVPEAVHLSSPNLAGLFTLAGFLSAVIFKMFEIQ